MLSFGRNLYTTPNKASWSCSFNTLLALTSNCMFTRSYFYEMLYKSKQKITPVYISQQSLTINSYLIQKKQQLALTGVTYWHPII